MDTIQRDFYDFYKHIVNDQEFMQLDAEPPCTINREISKMTFGQHIVHKIATDMLSQIGNRRGLLVFHGVGTGKTCSAAAIMDAFVGTGKKMFYITTYQGLRTNNADSINHCANSLFPRLFEDDVYDKNRYFFMTIRKFANAISGREFVSGSEVLKRKEALQNSVIILDEIHKLFDPSSLDSTYYREAQEYLLERRQELNCVIVLLTATPGRTTNELCDLLNIIRDPFEPPITFENEYEFQRNVQGLVSYIDMSNDHKLFPFIQEKKLEIPMSRQQQEQYMIRFKKDDIRGARRYSNSLFEKNSNMLWSMFSPKTNTICDNIMNNSGKHYAYSTFYDRRGTGGHGIHNLAALLEENGYTQLLPSMCKNINLIAQPRYIILTNKDVSEGSTSENIEHDNLEALLNIYNDEKNINGDIVKVILASQGYNESIDLHAVQYVHIMEPQLDYIDEIQTIGRAARRCSHSRLPYNNRIVNVYRYLSVLAPKPDNNIMTKRIYAELELTAFLLAFDHEKDYSSEYTKLEHELNSYIDQDVSSIDHIIIYNAQKRYAKMKKALDLVRTSAIDCLITKKYHKFNLPCIEERAKN
jgi:superfamily II DNA or RNA helicase